MTTLLIDYSTARPDPDATRRSGYAGVMRYLAPVNNLTKPKLATRPEIDQLHARELSVGLVWEWTAGRALEGYQAGHDDRLAAERAAAALGYPTHCLIFWTCDTDADPAAVLPYAHGWHAAGAGLATMHPVGVYGSGAVIETIVGARLAAAGWQASATGWRGSSTVSAAASLYQRQRPTLPPIPGGGYDENVLIHPVSLWAPPVTPSPPPPSPPPAPTCRPWRPWHGWRWWWPRGYRPGQ